jgi:short-subunit dehydrogenase
LSIFKDKVTIVTGAASGIGQALASELAKNEAIVIATDVNTQMLKEAVGEMMPSGKVKGDQLDVTDYDAFKKLIDETVAQHGRLDYLFNNAGIGMAGEAQDQTIEHWRKVLDVNLNGVINGSILAYQLMVKQGFGYIVNMSSLEGLIAFPLTIPYVASKFAVLGLSQGLWIEGSDLGVKVSAVCPGFIETPIFETSQMVNFDRQELLNNLSTLGKFSISSQECARRILKGVARNKPIIVVTGLAKMFWWLSRISPTLVMKMTRKDFSKKRDKGRIKK